ncbi:hypothetical protein FOCG_00066 [Fusarium oxysporum f. sp. radicis-lycopersici 26381]|uniref:Uncharacterized protein n=3 Tax=Fusarium oxysporum TaxID=5507 RepID=A0A0J9UGF4_FUSO4|nr:hypothetical protein FOXG_18355 [Fusarium oxysporum f. sp. lycopersici 4287]EWZ43444.1 hypothetical protein FOZG_04553 [Fusarium oxysporum Fo47]EWZ81057.1 hypothetical protein FOWG_15045 [Fusarium oxysporum f. sp. lycopersici MN25]EXK27365.1 hypothetical protein FOMG_16173 [Fusarium oxysporum f. sp. melonis 26406]EXL60775.1 hypothetical protein FOCG_00066 [Fusarium oxysporum f. sp. radicis-lycopersici 26381]KNA98189.1 hypothetical protein FOXG_18355 [Fusarium oxysporum f. sp. lycopersici 42
MIRRVISEGQRYRAADNSRDLIWNFGISATWFDNAETQYDMLPF